MLRKRAELQDKSGGIYLFSVFPPYTCFTTKQERRTI